MLAIILPSWFGGYPYPKASAGGLRRDRRRQLLIAWGSTAVGLASYGGMSVQGLTDAVVDLGFSAADPGVNYVFSGLNSSGSSWSPPSPSASTISSRRWTTSRAQPPGRLFYPTTRVLTADGIVSLIGA